VSPDGRYLARGIRAGTPDEGIWIYDLTGIKPPRKLYDRFGFTLWLNDGEHAIVVDPLPESRYLTFRVKLDGTQTTPLPIPAADCVESCTRDGRWLAARDRSEKGRTRIHVMHMDGIARRTIVDEPDMPTADIQFSPDGHRLAYVKVTLNEKRATCALRVVEFEGKERKEVPISFDTGDMLSVRWSPDGKRFALGLRQISDPQRRPVDVTDDRVFVVDVDGSNMRKLPLPASKLLLSDWK
jgi:dipeptidyl aminopeptidase/acylaminoacyl peptidase